MRKALLVSIAFLFLTAVVDAQGTYLTDQEKQERIDEIKVLAKQLLAARKDVGGPVDAKARAKIRAQMEKKDVIEKNNRAAGDGFSVPAFKWLYEEGLRLNDTNARLHAIIGLESVKHATAAGELLAGLDDRDPAIQLRVLGAVRRKSIQRAWPQVMPKLMSPQRVVVAAAAQALATLGQDPDKQVSSLMIEVLSTSFDKLKSTPEDNTKERQDLEQLVEVLGRSYAELTRSQWPQTQKLKDVEETINKFKATRNQAYLGGLREPIPKSRLDALRKLKETPEKSVFFPVLEATVKAFQNLQAAKAAEDKAPHLTFLVEASGLLNRLSGLSADLTPASSDEDVQKAVNAWKDWYQNEINK